MRAFINTIALLMVLALAGTIGGWFYLQKWSALPIMVPQASIVAFPPGTSLDTLARRLEVEKVITSRHLFRLLVKIRGNYGRFQAGNYRFEGDMSPEKVEQIMAEGKTYQPIALQVIVPEGWSLRQLTTRLAEYKIGTKEELIALTKDPAFLKSLKVEQGTLEGYVYPATYSFAKFPSGKDFFSKTVGTFWEKMPAGYEAKIKAKGLTLNQAVTFASLIELETAAPEEKPLISEVIWRRLKDGIPLGIDAALIYGIPDYQGDILWKHLKDRENLYNTRIHHGLPPTAIGSVSASSLEAVLIPTNFGNYYYVLDLSAGKPQHHFSKTLKEHQMYVNRLVQTLNARKLSNRQKSEIKSDPSAVNEKVKNGVSQ